MPNNICKIPDCKRKHLAKGFCEMHYRRFKKSGNPLIKKTESHGMQKSPEYRIWRHIKDRCFNENTESYPYYGGRGITVCDRWLNSFIAFYEDMGPRPFPEAEIDREDNDGNYEPGNCRWVTSAVNNQNRSSTKLTMKKAIDIRAKYATGNFTQIQLSKLYGVCKSTIGYILNNKIWKESV